MIPLLLSPVILIRSSRLIVIRSLGFEVGHFGFPTLAALRKTLGERIGSGMLMEVGNWLRDNCSSIGE